MSGFRAFVVTCALCVGGVAALPHFSVATHAGPNNAPAPAPTAAPAARTFFKVGERIVAYFGDYGCPSADHMKALQKLDAEHDHIAEALAAKKYECLLIEPRDVGVVEDSSVLSGLSCVRRQGEPECLWYPTPIFIAEAEAAANDSRDAANKAVLDKVEAEYDATPKGAMELRVLSAFLTSRKPGQIGYGNAHTRAGGTCDIESADDAKGDLKAGDGLQISWIFRRATIAEMKTADPDYTEADFGPPGVWLCTPFRDDH